MSEITTKKIETMIYVVRGQKVMLDCDLAQLYCVLTKNLNKAVIRNIEKFPTDFMFKLSKKEFEDLRFQFGTFKTATKGRKYLPHVFTEYGIVALSGILNSEVATKVNISIVRTFIKMRRSLYAFSINNVMHTSVPRPSFDWIEISPLSSFTIL